MPGNSLAESWPAAPVGRTAAPLREQVIATLRQAILDFHLVPGQRLVERELIENLGVSRTTIREALRELASEGLVTVVPQRGAIVSAPSLEDATDLYEVRASLESLMVQRFVERASDDQVEQLSRTVGGFADVVNSGAEVREILAAKSKFYAVLTAGASCNAVQQLLEAIQARVQALRATSLAEPGRAHAVVDELEAIVAAIRARDAARASALMSDHVRTAAHTALAHLKNADPA
ncbi:GntR family transcriptional regulator [Mycolicibacterium goodii]|uniref:GntR family transcriptional regulator n=1 Tax=Mycolicibacterium goodii TaxID=134601 RepID=UPI00093D265E|nr:GntR family transcriptional regulator [Mycolicibacterium goodii]MBU8817152.1 GntR family transcriptional regulator [Mycolicibacterium goodii]MBU8827857.1 GntR family transcriptional regulator [Mycolicibacterium goodii]OKH63524.1 GntR family transcriptional regulator [Mycobacterium sp. SWH-M5]ULN47166.1 GntR family transcriptional regulator [Mycolicibacterium goodii]